MKTRYHFVVNEFCEDEWRWTFEVYDRQWGSFQSRPESREGHGQVHSWMIKGDRGTLGKRGPTLTIEASRKWVRECLLDPLAPLDGVWRPDCAQCKKDMRTGALGRPAMSGSKWCERCYDHETDGGE